MAHPKDVAPVGQPLQTVDNATSCRQPGEVPALGFDITIVNTVTTVSVIANKCSLYIRSVSRL